MKSKNELNRERFNPDGKASKLNTKRTKDKQRFRQMSKVEDWDDVDEMERFERIGRH